MGRHCAICRLLCRPIGEKERIATSAQAAFIQQTLNISRTFTFDANLNPPAYRTRLSPRIITKIQKVLRIAARAASLLPVLVASWAALG